MDWMQIALGALALLNIVGVGFAKVLYSTFQDVKKRADTSARELAEFKLHCSETYSTKDDLTKAIEQFSRSIDAVFAKLERIEDKLDNKQDKQ
jgi:septal ring factor EnvC (AmiA/AmiB activator)